MIKDLATGIYRNPANQRPALSKRERAKIKRQAKKAAPLAGIPIGAFVKPDVPARVGGFFA